MADTLKKAVADKIEIVDPVDETIERKGRKLWFILPAALVLSTLAFFAVRRVFNKGADA